MGLRIALIIGVNRYNDDYYNDLKGAVTDASLINGFLRFQNGFETILLPDPKSEDVLRALAKISASLDDDSVFIFYFAGHGLTIGSSDRPSLLCSDATQFVARGSTDAGAISPGVLTDFVHEGRGDMFFCFDACRTPAISGRNTATNEGTRGVRDAVAKIDRKRNDGRRANCWTLSSCGDRQIASDGGEFAKSLIEAMSCGLRTGKGVKFGDEFVALVESNLNALRPNTGQRPEASGRPFTLAPCAESFINVAPSTPEPTVQTPPAKPEPSAPVDVARFMEEFEEMRRRLEELQRVKTPDSPPTPVAPADVWIGTRAGKRREIQIKGVSYGFCWIPPGTFMMGSPETERGRWDSETLHSVCLTRGFWALETPVTQGLWKSVTGSNPSWFCSTGGGSARVAGKDTTDFPVEEVSWNDCQEFIKKLNALEVASCGNFRLPTEAEWEYACRAGTNTPYWWGGTLNGDRANCDGNYPYGTNRKGKFLVRTCAVKSYAPNPWGLYDVHGNVYEWCSDGYGAYPLGDVVDPTGTENASSRVIRGGGWGPDASDCRSAHRSKLDPAIRYNDGGFRLILE